MRCKNLILGQQISIHALREEGDWSGSRLRRPWRCNFNPRPPRGGRRPANRWYRIRTPISIHALREESDMRPTSAPRGRSYFNPRPPRGERPPRYAARIAGSAFQSTPSARRATPQVSIGTLLWLFQSTPSARRATKVPLPDLRGQEISIHALREESDSHLPHADRQGREFQSTPSARRATPDTEWCDATLDISIHALREESDLSVDAL